MPDVWIIEDNAAFRRATQRALRVRADISSSHACSSCEEALTLLSGGPPPEVILLDIGLPGIDGIEGIRRIKALAPGVSILVLTVFEDDDKIFRAICAGASGYLLKSEPIDTVVAAVEEVRRGGSPMLPQVARKVMDRLNGRQRANPETVLSDRERAVLQAMSEGLSKKEVAMRLELSAHTVDNYLRRIYAKLHVNTMQGAVGKALKDRLL